MTTETMKEKISDYLWNLSQPDTLLGLFLTSVICGVFTLIFIFG